MLRFLVLIGVLVFSVAASAGAEMITLAEVEKGYGNYQATCENMVLAKPAAGEDAFSGKVTKLTFDVEQCKKVLAPIQMNIVLKPFLELMVRSSQARLSNSRIVRTVRQLIDERRQKTMVRTLHVSAQPMADACHAAAAGREVKGDVLCYFGGPSTGSGNAFKAIFQSLLDDSLPNQETLCTADPLTAKTASAKPFREMLAGNKSPVAWEGLRSELDADDFQCEADRCFRNLVTIMLPKGPVLESKSGINGHEPFAILPRQLTIFRGDWHIIEPPSFCIAKDGSGKCHEPSNGVRNGICLAKEDGHTWGLSFYVMNEFRSE